MDSKVEKAKREHKTPAVHLPREHSSGLLGRDELEGLTASLQPTEAPLSRPPKSDENDAGRGPRIKSLRRCCFPRSSGLVHLPISSWAGFADDRRATGVCFILAVRQAALRKARNTASS
jgi:hypothetical protein